MLGLGWRVAGYGFSRRTKNTKGHEDVFEKLVVTFVRHWIFVTSHQIDREGWERVRGI
jgi:hypothetical protein